MHTTKLNSSYHCYDNINTRVVPAIHNIMNTIMHTLVALRSGSMDTNAKLCIQLVWILYILSSTVAGTITS